MLCGIGVLLVVRGSSVLKACGHFMLFSGRSELVSDLKSQDDRMTSVTERGCVFVRTKIGVSVGAIRTLILVGRWSLQ